MAARTVFVHMFRACLASRDREVLFGFLCERDWRFLVVFLWAASSGVHQARSFLLCSLMIGVALAIAEFRRSWSCAAALSTSSAEDMLLRSGEFSWMWAWKVGQSVLAQAFLLSVFGISVCSRRWVDR